VTPARRATGRSVALRRAKAGMAFAMAACVAVVAGVLAVRAGRDDRALGLALVRLTAAALVGGALGNWLAVRIALWTRLRVRVPPGPIYVGVNLLGLAVTAIALPRSPLAQLVGGVAPQALATQPVRFLTAFAFLAGCVALEGFRSLRALR